MKRLTTFTFCIVTFSICFSETITGPCSDPVCDSINWVAIERKLGSPYADSGHILKGKRVTEFGEICNLDTFPEEIGNLTELISLNLNGGSLTSGTMKHLPASIGNLTRLQHLDLSQNQLEDLPPTIGRLVNLKELYLGRNNLHTLPDSIVHIIKLERNWDLPGYQFDIERNHICSLPGPVKKWIDTTYGGNWINAQCNDCPKGQINCGTSTKQPSLRQPTHRATVTSTQLFDLRGKKLNLPRNGAARNSLPKGCYIIRYGTGAPHLRRYVVP